MVYLIDYENVSNAGLSGYEFLTSQDVLYLFYSDAARNIRKQISLKIFDPSMDIHLYKLKTPRKNAIDFYIASKLGELEEKVRFHLAGTEFEEDCPKVIDIFCHADTKKSLYLSSFKNFGRERGTKLYANIREIAR